jgi:FtsP/CotA-like multicopper oxidase with cupredoxin domain
MSLRRRVLAAFLACVTCAVPRVSAQSAPYTPVITPNGATLPWKMVDGAKEFHLVVEPIEWEMAPGMTIKAWGYNGRTPGPTIEAVEGDRVRILVTNKLGEGTATHWHGLLLPPGMDGVQGITQPSITPGDTFAYEFTLKQHGTHMYHSHGDELVQIGLGTMGFFIIHPRERAQKIDRDYAIFLNEWRVDPGTDRPNPSEMTEFNLFSFNSRVYPGTAPLVARPGERVRIRVGHVGQDFHAIHLHGHQFPIVATDGGDVPASAQMPETTIAIGPGQTRDIEFIATAGDWPMHCHLRHHPMNAMGHEMPNMIGVDQRRTERKIQALIPGYMAMGQHGMEEMTHMQGMPGPRNTLPMMAANDGPFGSSGMGGMFTLLKVHDDIPIFPTMEAYARRVQLPADLGWYKHPPGTVAASIHRGRRPGVREEPSGRRERRREPAGHEQHGGSGAGSHSGH